MGRGGVEGWAAALWAAAAVASLIDAGVCVDLRRMRGLDWYKPLLWGLPGLMLTPAVWAGLAYT